MLLVFNPESKGEQLVKSEQGFLNQHLINGSVEDSSEKMFCVFLFLYYSYTWQLLKYCVPGGDLELSSLTFSKSMRFSAVKLSNLATASTSFKVK